MDKDAVLAKSRAENKNRDMYEQEILKQANSNAIVIQTVLAAVFFMTQILVKSEINWGLWALVLSASMTTFWVKYKRLHRRHELIVAVVYTILVVIMSGYYIYSLIASSSILGRQ